MAIYINSHQRKGAPLKKPEDFIVKSYWKTDVEKDVDVIKKAFGLK
ncbi:MAG: hypothetical protein OQK29_01495 [Ignavibacteriaceae bacterium]|nr:hypothetical protein [Ignavibacteriaceae bacterium]